MLYLIPTDTCFWIWCSVISVDDYNEIYNVKWRWFDKLLAVMVWDFEDIKNIAEISEDNLNFIKNYPYPFSVLLTPKSWFLPLDLPNIWDYKRVSVRVANIKFQKDLIKKLWPIFLTSANKSGEEEIYSVSEFKRQFVNDLDKIEIADFNDIEVSPPSDIFLIKDTWELEFVRRNYSK